MSIEKQANANLFAFNNHIVALKTTIKQSKVQEIRKLTRKLNLLKNKKANETHKEKNERKAKKILEEVNIIKKLKFNDVAVFAMENEFKFEQIIKSKPDLSLNEKAIARIGVCKVLAKELEKIKEVETDWKKLLIQYKSRMEKKRNWKEKQKLYKDIEEKLTDNVEKVQAEDGDESLMLDGYDSEDDDQDAESVPGTEETDEKSTTEPTPETKETDEKSVTEPSPEPQKENKKEEKKKKEKQPRKKNVVKPEKIIVSEKENSETEEQKDDNNSNNEESEDEKVDYKNKLLNGTASLKVNENYKPWLKLNTNESKQMIIKQIDLDELSHLKEIPIEPITEVSNTTKEKEDTAVLDQRNKKVDSFFLSRDGKEQFDDSVDQNNKRVKRYGDFDDDHVRYSKRKYESSFMNSLSSYNEPSYNRKRDNFDNKFNGNGFKNGDYKKKDFNPKRNDSWNPKRNDFNSRQNGNNNKKEFRKNVPAKEPEDKNLHPSWIAKKEQQEKLKNLDFKGTKIKFDDD